MKNIIILFTVLLSSYYTFAQETESYKIKFTEPESVVNAIFYSAKEKDYSIMSLLCDPYNQGDGETKSLCSISEIGKKTENGTVEEESKHLLEMFLNIFTSAKITGETTYVSEEGLEYAKVPFQFTPLGQNKAIDKTMTLIKRYGNWYLLKF